MRRLAASGTGGQEAVILNGAEPPNAVDAGRLLARTLRQIGYRPRLRLVHEEDRLGELVSERVGNDRFHPLWGPLIGQLWVR